jgi:CheY-like chemotaxis protein
MTPEQTASSMRNTVLVIDDEPLTRDIATLMMENVGRDILVAGDGLAGSEIAAQHRREIFLTLSDLRMAAQGKRSYLIISPKEYNTL